MARTQTVTSGAYKVGGRPERSFCGFESKPTQACDDAALFTTVLIQAHFIAVRPRGIGGIGKSAGHEAYMRTFGVSRRIVSWHLRHVPRIAYVPIKLCVGLE